MRFVDRNPLEFELARNRAPQERACPIALRLQLYPNIDGVAGRCTRRSCGGFT